ncbi:MAG TPA: hypothetical protein VGX50_10475 [Longimicrobium sp.]|jgi:hypothetical protein|nr:hypothetical protein [Longimicrobium sp.]
MMHRTFAVVLTVALAACGGGGTDLLSPLGSSGDATIPGLRYETNRIEYSRGDEIVSQLVNASEHNVGYNLCTSALERRTGGGWVVVRRNPERPCTLPLYTLSPGQTTTYREPASAVPSPGTYRLRAQVEAPLNNGTRHITTAPFTVQ